MDENYMTVKEVMFFLGLARPTIYKYVSQGRLTPYHKGGIGRVAYFKREEVEKLNNLEPAINSSRKTKQPGEI